MTPKKGFTLLEVLLTVVLVSVGFAALLQSAGVAIFASGSNELELTAVNIAQNKMEDIRTGPYTSIVNESRSVLGDYPAFEREVVVTTPVTNLRQVTVNVYWTTKSTENNISLVTYVSNI